MPWLLSFLILRLFGPRDRDIAESRLGPNRPRIEKETTHDLVSWTRSPTTSRRWRRALSDDHSRRYEEAEKQRKQALEDAKAPEQKERERQDAETRLMAKEDVKPEIDQASDSAPKMNLNLTWSRRWRATPPRRRRCSRQRAQSAPRDGVVPTRAGRPRLRPVGAERRVLIKRRPRSRGGRGPDPVGSRDHEALPDAGPGRSGFLWLFV